MSRRVLIIIGVVVGVIVLGVATVGVLVNTVFRDSDSGGQASDPYAPGGHYTDGCQDGPVSFTTWPVPVDRLDGIIPMGSVSSEHIDPTDHLYFAAHTSYEAADVPYVSPADGRIVEVYSLKGLGNANLDSARVSMDVGAVLQFGCRYYARIAHLHDLAPEIASAVGTLDNASQRDVNIPLTAGQVIGHVGQQSDLAILDTQAPAPSFVHLQDYAAEPWKRYTIDPLPLFPESVRADVAGKIARKAEPVAGMFAYDVAGSAQGAWFGADQVGIPNGGGDPYWKRMLTLAPYWNDPSLAMVVIGDWNGKWGFFLAQKPMSFSSVTATSGVTVVPLVDAEAFGKIDGATPQQVAAAPVVAQLIVQVDAGEHLTAEIVSGSSAPSGFTGHQRQYAR